MRCRRTVGRDVTNCCSLTPEETAGPYPLFNDIASASTYMREDITEGKTGDKDGVYSGYNQPGSNTVGQTFCRGVQMTDSTGLARFTTIYPGW